ncbi:MAG: hypothetical protein KF774_20650 [Planctomyces sp.]|nr:hypothetical protein [Planctomyces sp.]
MPAWPGGDCPECGEQMPANVIRCATCRALLNNDLAIKPIVPPEFVPLPEIATSSDVSLRGVYLPCPACTRELRISQNLFGQRVQCRFCHHPFDLKRESAAPLAGYASCPHCHQELRAAPKYLGIKVSCRHCGGSIRLVDPKSAPA